MDLGGVVGVAEVGEPGAGVPVALRALVLEAVGGDDVEGVEGFGEGDAVGGEELEGGAGEGGIKWDIRCTADREVPGSIAVESDAENLRDGSFDIHGGEEWVVGYLVVYRVCGVVRS